MRPAGFLTAVLDVEPLLAPWNSDSERLRQGLESALAALAAASSIERVFFLTNSRRTAPPGAVPAHRAVYTSRAGKPWRLAALRDAAGPIAVVGDQPLTDGLLAWRMRKRGAVFFQIEAMGGPAWPRLQAAIGRAVAVLIFRNEPT
jgi:hypothetical protein